MNTPTFTAQDWFHIGCGDVAIVDMYEDTPRGELYKKLTKVVIDGHEYEPIGVESFRTDLVHEGDKIGILVKERVK